MSPKEFHIAINTGLQQFNTDVYEVYKPQELDLVINKMIERFVKQRFYFGSNPKGKGFEQNQKRYSDLHTLVKTKAVAVPEGADKNEYAKYDETAFDLPEDYLFYVGGIVEAKIDPFGEEPTESSPVSQIPVMLVEHEKLDYLMRNPFTIKDHNASMGTIEESQMRIFIHKRSLLKRLVVTYVCKPNKLDVLLYETDNQQGLCDLPEHTHSEIVDLTIEHILEILQSNRLQQKGLDVLKQE